MILDLRDNPGGIVEQAVGVASNFVPPNSTIVSYTEQDGKVDQYTAQGTEDLIPLVVLVNENSASASEIIAGAVQDMQLGPIVGVKTYGKGTVQGVFPLSQQSAVKVTVLSIGRPMAVKSTESALNRTSSYPLRLGSDRYPI